MCVISDRHFSLHCYTPNEIEISPLVQHYLHYLETVFVLRDFLIPFLSNVIFNFTLNTVPILSSLSGLSKSFIVKKLSTLSENFPDFLWLR